MLAEPGPSRGQEETAGRGWPQGLREDVRKGRRPSLGTEEEPVQPLLLQSTALSSGLLGGRSPVPEVLGRRGQGNPGCFRQRKPPDLVPGVQNGNME